MSKSLNGKVKLKENPRDRRILPQPDMWHYWKELSNIFQHKSYAREIYKITDEQNPEGGTSHETVHSIARSAILCKGPPPRIDQVLNIHLSG